MKNKVIVFCDFDGTITDKDALVPIYSRFASCGTHFADLWHIGEIGTREEFIETFNCIHSERAQLESVLDEITIDQGIHDILSYCRKAGLAFSIISDGFEWYIRYILQRYGISNVNIFANQIIFEADGSFRFEFPWFNEINPKRALYKPDIINKYHQAGYHTIFIGNGSSDQDAVWEAERIYAKNPLYEYCLEKKIEAQHFESFDDLVRIWKKNPPHENWQKDLAEGNHQMFVSNPSDF